MKYVKVGVLSIALLGAIMVLSPFLNSQLYIIMILLWMLVTAELVIMVRRADPGGDLVDRLRRAPKNGLFGNAVEHLVRDYYAVESQSEHLQGYDADSSITKSYQMISSQMKNIMESAIKYISTYNYFSRPVPSYLEKLVHQADGLVTKLNELMELLIQVEDSTSDVDVSYVDDLLDSLRQMRDD